jgi:cell division septum initiation protein DivIVA
MNNHGDFRNGHDRGSSLFPYVGVRERDLEGSIDAIPVDRLAALVNGEDHIPAVPTMTADPQQAEVEEDDAGAEGVGPAAGLLALAQKVHDEYVAEGQARYDSLIAEAEALLAEANAEREHMITAARERSTEMVGEARQQRDAMLHDLGSERGLLEKKIEDLRTFERGHRALMKSYLEGQLIELENGGADQTGSDAGN